MSHRPAPLLVAVTLVAAVSAACVAGGSPAPSASASPSLPGGFYLRAWTTQAVEPQSAFSLGARLVIADGRLIDTAVAVPAIYPGPLLIEPLARTLSAHGVSTIEDALRTQGLLVSREFATDTIPPGGITAHLEVVVDGTRYELSGDPSRLVRCASGTRCVPDPGTPEAFAAFWGRITGDLTEWLGADLGPEGAYDIERLAILLIHPIETFAPVPGGGDVATWPLTPFASFGSPYAGARCGTVSGRELAVVLPILRRSNALTRFSDGTGDVRSLRLRPLLPGEPDICTAAPPTGTPAPSPWPTSSPIPPEPTAASLAPEPGATGGGTGGSSAGPGSSAGGSGVAPGSSGSGGLGVPTVAGLGCFGTEPAFPATALAGPAVAEQGTDAVAEALRALIREASATGMAFPTTGWRRVVDTPTEVLFLAEAPAADFAYVSASFTRTSSTAPWQRGGYGSCRLMTVLERPFGPATWTLGAPAGPGATEVTALVSELACAGGTPAIGRVSDPLIEYGPRTVTITFGVEPLAGAQTCQSNPPAPVAVHLRQPLGERQLLDGGLYPAAFVEVVNPN